MLPVLADSAESVVVVVDLQPSFLKAIDGAEEVLRRSVFLLRAAQILQVPVLATVQNPERMGRSDPRIEPFLTDEPPGKLCFSCVGCPGFDEAIARVGRRQAVLVGIETHICVNQTAHHLLQMGKHVVVCGDAVGSRTPDRHALGLARLRDAGAVLAHSESVVYEWMGSAAHPQFREVLEVVKQADLDAKEASASSEQPRS